MAFINEGRFSPDPRQRAAVREDEGKFVVIGAHGTGKTSTLIARVAFLLAREVPARQISCVTHSDETAAELRRRMKTHPLVGEQLDNLFVGSIDHLCNNLLREGGALALGMAPEYTVWDRPAVLEAVQLARRASRGRKLRRREIEAFLRWRRNNLARWPDEAPLPPREGFWPGLQAAYDDEMKLQNGVDVDMLPALAYAALGKDEDLRQRFSNARSRHLLVDDGEHFTLRQGSVLEMMVGPTRSVMVTVLSGQSLDMTNSRSPVAGLLLPYPTCRVHHLNLNHGRTRSLFHVSDALQDVRMLPDPFAPGDTCDGPEGELPLLVEVEGTHEDMDRLALDQVQRWARQGIPWESLAVLDRRGRAVARMRTQLAHRDIPYRVLGEVPPDLPTDARCAVAMLTLLLNPGDLRAARVASAADHPNVSRLLEPTTSLKWRDVAAESGRNLMDAIQELLPVLGPSSPHWDPLLHLGAQWEGLNEDLSDASYTFEDICFLVKAAVLVRRAGGLPEVVDAAMDRFLDFCLETPPLQGESNRDRLRRVLDLWSPALHPARRHQNEHGVVFAGFEAARGISANAVILLGLNDNVVPGKMGPYSDALGLELELFCDAVARASRFLHLYYLADTGRGGARYAPSRFLNPVRHLLDFHREPYRPPESYPDPFGGTA